MTMHSDHSESTALAHHVYHATDMDHVPQRTHCDLVLAGAAWSCQRMPHPVLYLRLCSRYAGQKAVQRYGDFASRAAEEAC